MSVSRRHALASLIAAALLAMPAAAHAETIRIGLPTKTYWPTTVAETAVKQKLFEKEGITAELTIYRSGAETFEAMAAGAADVILDPPSLVSAATSLAFTPQTPTRRTGPRCSADAIRSG